MITVLAWIYLIWQAWRAVKKLLGFSQASWDEVFAPTFILAAIVIFGVALAVILMLFVGLMFVII